MSTEMTQDALESAAVAPGHFYKGKRLEPFSFGRQTCWERCKYDKGESDFESKIAIVFICTLGEEIATGLGLPEKSTRTGIDLMEAARGVGIPFFRSLVAKWADQEGFTGNNPEGREAAHIGYTIWEETKQSRFKVVSIGGGNPDPNG